MRGWTGVGVARGASAWAPYFMILAFCWRYSSKLLPSGLPVLQTASDLNRDPFLKYCFRGYVQIVAQLWPGGRSWNPSSWGRRPRQTRTHHVNSGQQPWKRVILQKEAIGFVSWARLKATDDSRSVLFISQKTRTIHWARTPQNVADKRVKKKES